MPANEKKTRWAGKCVCVREGGSGRQVIPMVFTCHLILPTQHVCGARSSSGEAETGMKPPSGMRSRRAVKGRLAAIKLTTGAPGATTDAALLQVLYLFIVDINYDACGCDRLPPSFPTNLSLDRTSRSLPPSHKLSCNNSGHRSQHLNLEQLSSTGLQSTVQFS